MKVFSLRTFTPWAIALLSLAVLAGCGSGSNPINPTAAGVSQVSAVNSTVPSNVFSATLTGTEEAPPNSSTATGTGVVVIDPATRAMKATIVAVDLNVTAAHIHVGSRGVAGPVVFPLTQVSAGSGIWTAMATLTTEQLSQIQTGNYYFNVHSAAFPDGEIRGQITARLPQSGVPVTSSSTSTTTTATTGATGATGATGTTGTASSSGASGSSGTSGSAGSSGSTDNASTTGSATGTGGVTPQATAVANRPVFFTNVLTGSLVVPATGSAGNGTGLSVYRARDKTLTSVVVTTGFTSTGAAIHQGAPDANGPVVANMQETSSGSGIWVSRATLNDTQVSALNAGNMYYEVISVAFPNGEIRGQIARTAGANAPAGAGTTTGTPASVTTTGTGTGTGTASGTTSTPTTGTSTGTTTPATGTSTGTTTTPTTGTSTGTITTPAAGTSTGTTTTPAAGTSTGTITTPTTGTTTGTTTTPTTGTTTGTITTPTSDTTTGTGTGTGTTPATGTTPDTTSGTGTTSTNGTTGTLEMGGSTGATTTTMTTTTPANTVSSTGTNLPPLSGALVGG